MKKLTKEQQRENVAVAYSIIGGIPAKYFHLDQFCNNQDIATAKEAVSQIHCGTVGCTLGWLSMHPYFIAQGLYLRNGYVHLTRPSPNEYGDTEYDSDEAARILFGRNAFNRYFTAYGEGSADTFLIAQHQLPTQEDEQTKADHKTLALARLKRGYDLTGRPPQVRKQK